MSSYTFKSNFADYMQELIAQKRDIGYKYNEQAEMLRRFDIFCFTYYPDEKILSKEIVLHWATRTCTESVKTQKKRMAPVRSLSEYMNVRGDNAYIYPVRSLPRNDGYVPHIFSDDELAMFFNAIDQSGKCSVAPLRHFILPTIFRVIYCCGLRISEAQNLKTENVDLDNGILTVLEAKHGKDRLVPMSDELTEICRVYAEKAHIFEDGQEYFFPNRSGGKTSQSSLYKFFREKLWEINISHGGRGSGPRIHDFRHTFAVNCLKNWVLQKKDLNAYLPYLKTYLGHYSFNDTAYYLRLTAEMYPNITEQIEKSCGLLIPQIGGELNA